MTKGEKIKELRKKSKLSQVDLAKKIGVSKQTLYKYENDIVTNIPSDKIWSLSEALDTTPAYLMGWTEPEYIVKQIGKSLQMFRAGRIPVLSSVPCGQPTLAEEYRTTDDYVEIEYSLAKSGEYYGLRARGDSMLPKIEEGDTLIVHFQRDVESGQVAIVKVNGEDATCKRIKKYRDGIELIGFNPSFEPRFFTEEEIKTKPVEIIGRVVEVRSKL